MDCRSMRIFRICTKNDHGSLVYPVQLKATNKLKSTGGNTMNRKYSIDILRILSAIVIIIIHVVTSPVANSTNIIEVSLENNLNLIHNLMLWSVPVFFMITGYCLLLKKECTYRYCFSHVLKYIAVLFTVGLFYALLEEVYSVKSINVMVTESPQMSIRAYTLMAMPLS